MISGIVASSGAIAAVPSDPEWLFVVLLCGFNGADGATTAPDESFIGFPLTFNGNAALDTDQFKFPTASLLLDGTNSYVSVPDDDSLRLGPFIFTLEMFVRFANDPSATSQVLMSKYETGTNQLSWYLRWVVGNTLEFAYSTDGTTMTVGVSATWDPAPNVDYHIAIVRSSSTVLLLFVDGVLLATGSISGTIHANTAPNIIGARDSSAFEQFLDGWIDELRLTFKARYTSTFTPPAAPFPRA